MVASNAILDERGRPLFVCRVCRQPLTTDDFFYFGMRLPDEGESAEDYFEAELLDGIDHDACVRARRSAS
jgi:hypothetical protein